MTKLLQGKAKTMKTTITKTFTMYFSALNGLVDTEIRIIKRIKLQQRLFHQFGQKRGYICHCTEFRLKEKERKNDIFIWMLSKYIIDAHVIISNLFTQVNNSRWCTQLHSSADRIPNFTSDTKH